MSVDEDFFLYSPGLFFVASADGSLLRVSEALSDRFAGRFAAGATLRSLVSENETTIVDAFTRALATSEAVAECTFHLVTDSEPVQLRCAARRAPDGALHGQVEVLERAEPSAQLERKLLRTVMDTLEIALWAVEPDGTFVYHDGKALATAGLTPGQFIGLNVFELYPANSGDQIRAALDGTPSHYRSDAHDIHWETWNVPSYDAAGEVDLCVGVTLDITAATETNKALTQQLETIRDQKQAIHDLSTPLLEVWDKILAVPLVGNIDDNRARALIDRLLTKVNDSGASFAIIDLTGVESIDTSTASHILRLLGSLRLLGVEGIITGISPVVAQIMVGLGIDLPTITTCRTLRDGLQHCMNEVRSSSAKSR